jgi:hypothetical protein
MVQCRTAPWPELAYNPKESGAPRPPVPPCRRFHNGDARSQSAQRMRCARQRRTHSECVVRVKEERTANALCASRNHCYRPAARSSAKRWMSAPRGGACPAASDEIRSKTEGLPTGALWIGARRILAGTVRVRRIRPIGILVGSVRILARVIGIVGIGIFGTGIGVRRLARLRLTRLRLAGLILAGLGARLSLTRLGLTWCAAAWSLSIQIRQSEQSSQYGGATKERNFLHESSPRCFSSSAITADL